MNSIHYVILAGSALLLIVGIGAALGVGVPQSKPGKPAASFHDAIRGVFGAAEASAIDQIQKDMVDRKASALKAEFRELFAAAPVEGESKKPT